MTKKRQTICSILLLILSAATGMTAETKGKLKTFLLLGQSNMEGWGDYSSLEKARTQSLEQNRRILYCSRETGWQVGGYMPSKVVTQPPDYKPYKVNGRFGAEFSFIEKVSRAYPNEEILFLKHAVGGTTLYAAWEKEWTTEKAEQMKETMDIKRRLYSILLEKMKIVEESAKQKGYERIDIQAVVWVQGESDANTEVAAQAYKANLMKFINNLRADLSDPDFKFVYLQVNPIKFPFIDLVRKSQFELPAEMKNLFVIPSSIEEVPTDFPKYDFVHYNSEGLLNIGEATADKVLEK